MGSSSTMIGTSAVTVAAGSCVRSLNNYVVSIGSLSGAGRVTLGNGIPFGQVTLGTGLAW